MHYVKPNIVLLFIVTPAFLIGDFIIARYFPAEALQFYQVHWAFLLFIIVLILSPLGRKPLVVTAAEKPRFSWPKWLALIWLFELSLIAVFAGLVQMLKLVEPELSSNLTMLNMQWIKQWGLFPWAAIVCLAVGFAYYAYCKGQDTFMSTLTYPLFKSLRAQSFGITANVCARLNTTLALIISLLSAILSLAWLITYFMGINLLHGLNIESVLTMIVILILTSHSKLGARLVHSLQQREWSMFKILMLIVALTAFLLVISSWAFNGTALQPVSLPEWLVKQAPREALFKFFLALWAFAWCSVTGAYIAYISRGYKIYQMILVSLVLPLLGFLVAAQFSLTPVAVLVLSLVGTAIILFLLTSDEHTLPLLMQVYVAGNDEIKYRSYKNTLMNFVRITQGLLFLYLPGGILLLGITAVMYTWPNIIYLSFTLVASVYGFFIKKL